MRSGRESLLLTCAVLGGLGGLACILQWLEIKPGDLRMTPTSAHWIWLVCGLLLFTVSIGLSSFSFFGYRRRIKQLEAEKESTKTSLNAHHAETLKRMETTHKAEEYRWGEAYKDYRKQIADLREQLVMATEQLAAEQAKPRFALSVLQLEAFRCAKKLRDWIAAVGSLATPPVIAGESNEERERRIESARAAYRTRLRFQYESEYRATAQVIYSKFAIENIRDLWIEQFLERVECNQQVLNIADGLEALAIRQFAPSASRLIETKLRPANETSEP